MKAYKFETTVQDNGVIRIPEMIKLANQRVEVFVVVSSTMTQDTRSTQPIAKFLEKWRGLLKDFDPSELKSQYLQEK